MKEATDVLAATARLLNAVAETLEKAANPLTAADVYPRREPLPAAEPAAPKRGKKTAATLAPSISVEPPKVDPHTDPLMQAETTPPPPPAAAAPAAGAPVLTEEQSAARAAELAKKLVEAYPEKEAGNGNRPKGFRLALEILSKFKVAKTTDLVHAQRLQFIAEGEALLPKAPAAA